MTGKPLTPRQAEVARLSAAGLSAAGIAVRLGIARSTACAHLWVVRARAGEGERARLGQAPGRPGRAGKAR